MKVEHIAKAAHELNRAYCQSIGDNSQPEWENAPEWQKSSAINGVNFHLENPDASPSASHDSWLKQKTEEGWTYGPEKNPETKQHPCFVPYEELPVSQKAKDYIFRQTVHSLKGFLEPEVGNESKPIQDSTRELTFGEKLVGITFNPASDDKVAKAKRLCAELSDLLNDENNSRENSQFSQRLFSHAVGEILNAQMNVVKVLTLKY